MGSWDWWLAVVSPSDWSEVLRCARELMIVLMTSGSSVFLLVFVPTSKFQLIRILRPLLLCFVFCSRCLPFSILHRRELSLRIKGKGMRGRSGDAAHCGVGGWSARIRSREVISDAKRQGRLQEKAVLSGTWNFWLVHTFGIMDDAGLDCGVFKAICYQKNGCLWFRKERLARWIWIMIRNVFHYGWTLDRRSIQWHIKV